MEQDYASELVSKWEQMGRLVGVKEQDRTLVAQRLEAAWRRTLGQQADPQALDREVRFLTQDGLFGGQQTHELQMAKVIGSSNGRSETRRGHRRRGRRT